jgi:hypothetical protein
MIIGTEFIHLSLMDIILIDHRYGKQQQKQHQIYLNKNQQNSKQQHKERNQQKE